MCIAHISQYFFFFSVLSAANCAVYIDMTSTTLYRRSYTDGQVRIPSDLRKQSSAGRVSSTVGDYVRSPGDAGHLFWLRPPRARLKCTLFFAHVRIREAEVSDCEAEVDCKKTEHPLLIYAIVPLFRRRGPRVK